MLDSTLRTVKNALDADPSLDNEDKRWILSALELKGNKSGNAIPRVIKASEAAGILGISRDWLNKTAEKIGLVRVYWPNGKRANGYTEASVRAAAMGNSNATPDTGTGTFAYESARTAKNEPNAPEKTGEDAKAED